MGNITMNQELLHIGELTLYLFLGFLIFLVLYIAGSYLIRILKKHRHKRLLRSTEYLPEEETKTLRQVFFLIMITICFVDIIYSLIFWTTTDFYKSFIYYDILASVIACLGMKKETRNEKIITLFLIPFSSILHSTFDDPFIVIIILLALHFIGMAYVIKVYYSKFIHYTESNGLGISILLLFGLVFVSFIFTSFTEGKNLLDSLVMVSNAFTSNGYAVLGESPIGKLNSIFLVWGGYILSGVGTATLTAALVSRHFSKRFEELEELIKNNNNAEKSNDSERNNNAEKSTETEEVKKEE